MRSLLAGAAHLPPQHVRRLRLGQSHREDRILVGLDLSTSYASCTDRCFHEILQELVWLQ